MGQQQAGLDPFSREALEFPAALNLFRPFLSGPVSEPALLDVNPRTDSAAILPLLAAAREANEYLRERSRPDFAGLADARPQVERLRIEGVSCQPLEILEVIHVARAACACRELFRDSQSPALEALASSLPDLRDLVKALNGKILPDGSLDSSASPALARIRRSIEMTQRDLHSSHDRILRRLGDAGILQEEVVSIRNGRFVLPVKSANKRQVEGIIHGSSSSGQSVYVEPMELLTLNNDLAELQDQEAAEVQRLLGEFSEAMRGRREELLAALRGISAMDIAFAKAEFARHYGACFPEFSNDRSLRLKGARHPLLIEALKHSSREAVPLTLDLRYPASTVIISGPNTGGKTVVLKTVGLAALMAQAGLPVVADEARLPFFRYVLADIGDKQSIEQSLSTFSAHVRNIQAIVEKADEQSLVLLDELGGSTDPHEGAALAMAILEHLRARRALALVSTHHSRLKSYAANTAGAVNAAMNFDEATLEPTYELLAGLPGKSSGIDIASRLGLERGIVAQARSLIEPGEVETSALIASLHAKRDELDAAIQAARRERDELELRRSQLQREMTHEREARLRELDSRLEQTLREHSRQWTRALDEIRRQAQAQSKSTRALAGAARKGDALVQAAREEWNASVLETIDQPLAQDAGPPPQTGDRVRVAGLSSLGIVTAILDGGEIEVEIGRLRMKTRREDARVIERAITESSQARPAIPAVNQGSESKAHAGLQDPPDEINVIGATAEEALERVDKFLDDAFLAGRSRLRVVHGFGKGILRKALREMLASHPHVAAYYPAPSTEGGGGATVVELKK